MKNIALLGLIDFENWNNKDSFGLGGSAGVIKSILPYLDADNIFLLGITSDKIKLNSEIRLGANISFVPIIYIPKNSKIPIRLISFWASRKINVIFRKYNIHSIYTHAEEMSFWIKPGNTILYHMHGSTNALEKARNKLYRNSVFRFFWNSIRIRTIKKATNIIAIDQLCYDIVKNRKYENKTLVIPNFVNTNVFYRDTVKSKLISSLNKKMLLFVGRLEEVKGLELFVDTILELNRIEEEQWKGVLVGSGTYRASIQKYIFDKKAEGNFEFIGAVFDQDELRRIYSQASVLMISSLFEGIPMVILESLACGTPVVSTNVGGIKDFIADDVMCFVNNKREPVEFAKLILNAKCVNNISQEFKFSSQKAAVIINQLLCSK